MNDPYSILGVYPSSSDDEIRSAYEELVRQNSGNGEKITELTNAYNDIMDLRRANIFTPAGNSLSEVRRLLSIGNYQDASSILDSIQERTAEWYFLSGSANYAKGWLDDAYSDFEKACRMEPYNPEYNSAFRHMRESKNGYMRGDPNDKPFGDNMRPVGGCSVCDICNGLICTDCCCECMGGDLIPCC